MAADAGTGQVGGRIVPLFWYVAGTIVVGSLAAQFEGAPEKAKKRTYVRKKRRTIQVESSSSSESEPEDTDAADETTHEADESQDATQNSEEETESPTADDK